MRVVVHEQCLACLSSKKPTITFHTPDRTDPLFKCLPAPTGQRKVKTVSYYAKAQKNTTLDAFFGRSASQAVAAKVGRSQLGIPHKIMICGRCNSSVSHGIVERLTFTRSLQSKKPASASFTPPPNLPVATHPMVSMPSFLCSLARPLFLYLSLAPLFLSLVVSVFLYLPLHLGGLVSDQGIGRITRSRKRRSFTLSFVDIG